jgi:hypothetical protein
VTCQQTHDPRESREFLAQSEEEEECLGGRGERDGTEETLSGVGGLVVEQLNGSGEGGGGRGRGGGSGGESEKQRVRQALMHGVASVTERWQLGANEGEGSGRGGERGGGRGGEIW